MVRGLLHVGTVSLSSLLLFLIQPMMGKMMLPWFGGSAGVWTTAMLFFQIGLLLGYLYAHWAMQLPARVRIAIHLLLLAFSCLLLPVAPWKLWSGEAAASPAGQIARLLSMSIGLPYFLLASTSPLVQAWRARGDQEIKVYRLYAISNLASLAALLLYPVVIEPWIATRQQLQIWSAGYAIFVLLCAASALGSGGVWPAPLKALHATTQERLLWIALAACPSALWLAMANTLSQNLAPVPLLWVVPLGVYLLSLVLCFDREGWYRPGVFRVALPLSWLVLGYGLFRPTPATGIKLQVALFASALLVCCLFCHGELARRKPHAAHLTSFYLMLAAGGAMGGLFVGLVAPHLFDRFLELPIAITGCVILGMGLLYGLPARRVARLLVVGGAAILMAAKLNDAQDHTLLRTRNFYGTLQVSETGAGDSAMRVLTSGVVRHGSQFADRERGRRATTYYGPASGAALALRSMGDRPLRVALIGLGVGALAAYARPGDVYRFIELNPAVIALARSGFRYLSESSGQVDVLAGDGRLALSHEPGPPFDAVIVDAFSGDSIPAHLLTREAFAIYFARLKTDGIVAVHITNRYVDLEGVVRGPAEEAGRRVMVIESPANPSEGTNAATWVVITPKRQVSVGRPSSAAPRIWTDDYSDLFGVLR